MGTVPPLQRFFGSNPLSTRFQLSSPGRGEHVSHEKRAPGCLIGDYTARFLHDFKRQCANRFS